MVTPITWFSGCYSLTGSLRQSVRFALMLGTKGKTFVKLGETCIALRANRIDQDVFLATFLHQYHRSPFHLGVDPFIVDLGCNIGLTMVDFKRQYPEATVVGVE